MVDYRTADKAQGPAVVAAGDFLLAFFYAEYTGGRDTRWQAYVAPSQRGGIAQALAVPGVTTESFTGTIRVWRMSALPASAGSIQVSECVDTAAAKNTDLSTGAVLPASEQNSAVGNYWLEIDILGKSHGLWQVIKVENPIYYPLALGCKP
jgi:hypothetical protein